MEIKDIKENYYFETLTDKHDLSYFDCGDEELNNFLKEDALKLQKSKLSLTKLIACNGKIVGYFSVLTDGIMIKKINNEKIKLDIKEQLDIHEKSKLLPAVKIGRLAIDKEFIGKGLGTQILREILFNLKRISETKVGFRFVIVEGYAKAINFYIINNGFEYLKKDDVKIKEIDFISQRDPTKKFFLYFDLEKFEKEKI